MPMFCFVISLIVFHWPCKSSLGSGQLSMYVSPIFVLDSLVDLAQSSKNTNCCGDCILIMLKFTNVSISFRVFIQINVSLLLLILQFFSIIFKIFFYCPISFT